MKRTPRRHGRRTAWAAAAALCLAAGCGNEPAPVHSEWAAMGTFCSLHLPAGSADELPAAAGVAREVIQQVNDRLTIYDTASELSRVNSSSGERPEQVSDMTRDTLVLACGYAQMTGGAFDPTVGPLVRLWGFSGGRTPQVLPSQAEIDEARRRVGYELISIEGGSAFLSTRGALVDLGGIAKGYAVDLAFDRIVKRHPMGLMVNLGGNIRCGGMARPGKVWQVGVRDPFEPTEILGTLTMTDGMAVATSGHYEKFVTIDGTRYAHIIDPRTGRPVTGMAGVTVVSDRAVEADALSTAFFVLGMRDSLPVLASLPHCGALFVPDVRPVQVYLTAGFAQRFSPAARVVGRVRLLAP